LTAVGDDDRVADEGRGEVGDPLAPDAGPRRGPAVAAIGCLMAVAGFFSGAMVAVLVARFVSWASHCPYDAGLPACDWQEYAGIGGLIGLVSLPTLVLLRLGRPRRRAARRGGR
jgi:MFS family permease